MLLRLFEEQSPQKSDLRITMLGAPGAATPLSKAFSESVRLQYLTSPYLPSQLSCGCAKHQL